MFLNKHAKQLSQNKVLWYIKYGRSFVLPFCNVMSSHVARNQLIYFKVVVSEQNVEETIMYIDIFIEIVLPEMSFSF